MGTEAASCLNPERIRALVEICRYKRRHQRGDWIQIKEFGATTDFYCRTLERHRMEIEAMLDELPETFKREEGDNLINMVNDKHGVRWGGVGDIDELAKLGQALGKLELLPRVGRLHTSPRFVRIK